jgi:hypothetical protein
MSNLLIHLNNLLMTYVMPPAAVAVVLVAALVFYELVAAVSEIQKTLKNVERMLINIEKNTSG